jgi:hypothetical protein
MLPTGRQNELCEAETTNGLKRIDQRLKTGPQVRRSIDRNVYENQKKAFPWTQRASTFVHVVRSEKVAGISDVQRNTRNNVKLYEVTAAKLRLDKIMARIDALTSQFERKKVESRRLIRLSIKKSRSPSEKRNQLNGNGPAVKSPSIDHETAAPRIRNALYADLRHDHPTSLMMENASEIFGKILEKIERSPFTWVTVVLCAEC